MAQRMPATPAANSTKSGRRRFLLAGLSAGLGGAAAVAMPQVSRAQTVNWRIQSAWPAKDVFHEFAVDYAKRVTEMASGRLRIDVVAAGSVVPPLQMADAVHAGILDGCHGNATLWYKKHKAYALFGTPPSFGTHHLLPLVTRFAERYPDIRVTLMLDEQRKDVRDLTKAAGIKPQ